MKYIKHASTKMEQQVEELVHLFRIGEQEKEITRFPVAEVIEEARMLVAGRLQQRGVQVQVTAQAWLTATNRFSSETLFCRTICLKNNWRASKACFSSGAPTHTEGFLGTWVAAHSCQPTKGVCQSRNNSGKAYKWGRVATGTFWAKASNDSTAGCRFPVTELREDSPLNTASQMPWPFSP